MKKVVFALVLLGGFHHCLQAQDAPKSKVAPKKQQAKQTSKTAQDSISYDENPFDISVESLPANYRGHSCAEIVRPLGNIKLEKDEFESSKAFAERIEFVKDSPLYGKLKGTSTLAFSPARPLLLPKYDADTETMTIKIVSHGSQSVRIGENFYSSAPIIKDLSDSRSYVAENGYGKKIEVNSFTYLVCGITFANVNSIAKSIHIPSEFSFKVAPELARDSKGNIGILYITNLSAPYIVRYSDYMKATMDSPTEISMSGPSIVTTLSQVWVYNTKTGQIFAKEPL
ncbi:hypothetical protein JAB1_14200 [Janthinobacterium sp. MP5059B]|uniref:hypothetical protein n=1 Tax=Janthinobacterium sp. MP5059B TaxID=1766683 RepID=UPI0008940AE6|nr:hypothetical protein [Janthinobacterium sp. MP5059B]OEZ50305.1 hypothetical protein JAB1_14200 [Janthinobacterium sp. MP5059B]